MKTKNVTLDEQTRSILLRSRIEGKNLYLPGQLPRPDYMRVAKAIEAAGGKWNRHAGCHIFPNDVRETLNITPDTVSVLNVQQTYQAFYTPPEVVEKMIELADVRENDRILEPSAGTGNILKALAANADKVAVEINAKLVEALRSAGISRTTVCCADFLNCNGDLGKFDRIVMNPPFSNGDDIKHILHARKFLNAGGKLVAICGGGPRQQDALKPISATWETLPAGTFKDSGTNVSTVLLTING